MERRCDNCRKKKRHFFKVLFGDFSHELRLPPAFTKYIEVKEEYGNATLRVCGGRTWQVELRKVDNHLVFRNGWSNFVVGNGLRAGNFLIFKHEGISHFVVRIFDESACEKRWLPAGEACRNAEGSNMSPSEGSPESSSSRHRGGRVTDPMKDAGNAACSFETNNPCFRKYFTDKTSCWRSYYMIFKKARLCHLVGGGKSSPLNGQSIREESQSYYPLILHVPMAFAKQHLKFKSCMLTLSDPQGRCYPVRYLSPSDYSSTSGLSSGWRTFSRENRLKRGDECVFEFIKERKGFNVHIFRGKPEAEGER